MVVIAMDPVEKKRIANEKRLKAVKQWKKNQTVQNIKPTNTRKIFEDASIPLIGESKPQLFDSEDEDAKYEECFKVRPQFEGSHGQELLEMSSQFSGRFKLDERFAEEQPPSQEVQNDEKEKNFKILQSVLGYEVHSKSSDRSLSKKRQIRFDPDDESASKYVKTSETITAEKTPKQKKSKKKSLDDIPEPSIPISTERYVEVSSNLKEILCTPAAPFSLSLNFSKGVDLEVNDEYGSTNDACVYDDEEIKMDCVKQKAIEEKIKPNLDLGNFRPKVKTDSFFIKVGDPRLKEGVEFFKRPKSMEEIKEMWYKKREQVMEMFRRKKRSYERSRSARAQPSQKKYSMRQHYFGK